LILLIFPFLIADCRSFEGYTIFHARFCALLGLCLAVLLTQPKIQRLKSTEKYFLFFTNSRAVFGDKIIGQKYNLY